MLARGLLKAQQVTKKATKCSSKPSLRAPKLHQTRPQTLSHIPKRSIYQTPSMIQHVILLYLWSFWPRGPRVDDVNFSPFAPKLISFLFFVNCSYESFHIFCLIYLWSYSSFTWGLPWGNQPMEGAFELGFGCSWLFAFRCLSWTLDHLILYALW